MTRLASSRPEARKALDYRLTRTVNLSYEPAVGRT